MFSLSRRHQLVLSASLGTLIVFLLLHLSPASSDSKFYVPSWIRLVPSPSHPDPAVQDRIARVERQCANPDPFEAAYGRANLRLSRAYEGSEQRIRDLVSSVIRGEPIKMAAIGGSVTKGHHVYQSEVWVVRFTEWLQTFFSNTTDISVTNGASPASGSDYFSYCFPLHVPYDSNLILVELAVNDEGIVEHIENMENLLRGLLDLPSSPAVILVEAVAFSNGGMGGGGGRMHLPVAQYYDVPVINQRHPLVNHFARYPQLVPLYFADDFWGLPDTRHVNARGHRDLAMLVASFVRDVACDMASSRQLAHVGDQLETHDVNFRSMSDRDRATVQAQWPTEAKSWRQTPVENQTLGRLMPGMFNTPLEQGVLPRLPVLEGWNPNLEHGAPPWRPTCLSTRTTDPQYNLTPVENNGWRHWVHPEYLDKPYLVTEEPGARVSFDLVTIVGTIKIYSLKSRTFGLGTAECWVNDDRDRAVKAVGWWDKDGNTGRFETVRDDLPIGRHRVTCELLTETSDPEGRHEFRLISVMSV